MATKAELITKLTDLGIAHDPTATNAVLEGLLPAQAGIPSSTNEITVTWNGGSRVYSREVHGEEFAALADEFVKKHEDLNAHIVA